MDPDMPIPSIESGDRPRAPDTTGTGRSPSVGNTPFQSLSPEKTPFRTPASKPTSPAPLKIPRSNSNSRANTPVRERETTPVLHSKRSHPNLGANRNITPQRQPFRRASSNLNPISAGANGTSNIFSDVPAPTLTASSVAKDYFKREIALHDTIKSKVAVFVHDSCFGHRFSRPRTSKAALSTIVERPERLLATLLGASTAYVRLGKRHASGSSSPHPDRDPATASPPPFAIRKTTRFIELNHPAVTAVHGSRWMEELQIMCDSAEAKLAMNGKELSRPIGYGKDETGNALPKLHEGDLYLCSESLAALKGCLGGVCDAVDAVFSPDETSRAFVNIRPPGHHCSSNFPSGFCWLNNVHVGISYASMNHNLTHAAIIDFDLHHGDGSQTIAWDHNQRAQKLPKNAAAHKKTPIGYYSLHDINSYPCEWGDEDKVRNASLCLQNAHGQSIWNVHLEPWGSLSEFWQLYESRYKIILQKTREFLKYHTDNLRKSGVRPKAAIFLSAGFDACQWESAGMQRHKVNVPTDFYARFTHEIVKMSEEDELGAEGRVISVLEGGYSDRALTSGVLSHLCGLANNSFYPNAEQEVPMNALGASDLHMANEQGYSALWWSESHLEELEAMVEGRVPAPIKKNVKQGGTYSSPTQASTMKMTENARERHSLSSQLEARLSLASRTPEPPPEVDWVTASYELSRHLIPDDRSTLSCRHDELNAENTKARRERQSLLNLPAQPDEKMQLRGRRTKPPADATEPNRKAARSNNRRTTIAAVNELPDHSMTDPADEGRPRRRSSAASSILSTFQDMKINDTKPTSSHNVPTAALPPHANNPSDRVSDTEMNKTSSQVRVTRSRSRERSIEQSAAQLEISLSGSSPAISKTSQNGIDTRSSSLSRQSSLGSSNITKDGLEELTSGMKKVSIKLKMPTQEQHEATQKKTAEENVKKVKQTRKPTVPRAKAIPTASTRVSKTSGTARKPASANVPARSTSTARSTQQIAATQMASPANLPQPPAAQQQNPTDMHEMHATGVNQVQNQISTSVNQQFPSPQINEQATSTQNARKENLTEPLVLHPPRLSAPTSTTTQPPPMTPTRRNNANLPVFTSTTPIPFAKAAQNPPHPGDQQNQRSIWDIPDTPHD